MGIRTWIIKALAILATVLLTGVSVALAGKIAFVGLIIPHIARFLSGVDYRWIIPVSGVLGGIFLATCDIVARFINYRITSYNVCYTKLLRFCPSPTRLGDIGLLEGVIILGGMDVHSGG